MIIKPFLVGHMKVFCYVLGCSETNEGIIIDPGGSTSKILNYISEKSLNIRYIINSHNHPDHTCGNRRIKEATGAEIVMHKLDEHFMDDQERVDFFARIDFPISDTPAPDLMVKDGDTITFGQKSVSILHTPGHSPGSMCLLCEDNLFTGDSLFSGGAGRVDLPEADFQTLVDSLERKIIPLPGTTMVWPGHDYGEAPVTTLEREKRENPYLGGEWQ